MASRELAPSIRGALRTLSRPSLRECLAPPETRNASTSAVNVLESSSSFSTPIASEDVAKGFDPVAQAKGRRRQLPPSRYQFRPPKYYRGPLHPHQPLPKADPASREFIPGPFMYTRHEQTWENTIAPDFMTLTYQHTPLGAKPPPRGPRLREWGDESPYYKNRPLRPPRGSSVLGLTRKPITFRNIPKITGVTIHSHVKDANQDSAYLHVAGMIVQAITNVRATVHRQKKSVQAWQAKEGKHVSITAHLKNEDAYNFVSKTVELVFPRIKEWKGVKGSSGDSAGGITFGFGPDEVALYPEIEVNYDMYPAKMIPGCHITIHTSAATDADARLLLTALGIPFYGKHVD